MIDVAFRAGGLSGRSAGEIGPVTLRAVLIRLAVAGRVEMAAEVDRVSGYPAVWGVPMIDVALRAGWLSEGAALEAVAVAGDAMQERLAVARRVEMAAEIDVVSRPDRHALSSVTRAHGVIRIPATRRSAGEENGCDGGAQCFPFHNRSQHARHA
jgi:hypothetical protein